MGAMLSLKDINGGKRDKILQSMRQRAGGRSSRVPELRLRGAGAGKPAGG